MQKKMILLIFGDNLPSKEHVDKIIKKYGYYYQLESVKDNFNEADFYNITIEERYTGLKPRQGIFRTTVPVGKIYLTKFLNIFKTLNCNLCLCKDNHEHPSAVIHGKEFEGYCYYCSEEEKKIIFIEDYGLEVNSVNIDDLYKKLLEMPEINIHDEESFKKVDWDKFIPVNERFCIENLEWYRQTPKEKRWLIIEANTNADKAFEHWLKELMSFGK